MNHLEIEYKTLLDKEEYQSLLPLFLMIQIGCPNQSLYRYPDQLIRKEKMALRVRTFTDQAELTLKVPEAVGHFSTIKPQPRRNRGDPSTPTVSDGEIKNLLISKEISVEQLAVWEALQQNDSKRNSCRIGGTRPQSLSRH